jgi:APA family basic amino acid/polyamine antiporter
MLSFSMAHLAVIRLRSSRPDHRGPYRSPGTLRRRGADDAAACSRSRCVMGDTGLSFRGRQRPRPHRGRAGSFWLALGLVVYVVYRRRQGLDLTTTVKVATPLPVTDREAEYESILVAFESGHYVEGAVATAVKLAARRRRGIHVS